MLDLLLVLVTVSIFALCGVCELGLFGEPRVNVLALNLALDAAWPAGGLE